MGAAQSEPAVEQLTCEQPGAAAMAAAQKGSVVGRPAQNFMLTHPVSGEMRSLEKDILDGKSTVLLEFYGRMPTPNRTLCACVAPLLTCCVACRRSALTGLPCERQEGGPAREKVREGEDPAQGCDREHCWRWRGRACLARTLAHATLVRLSVTVGGGDHVQEEQFVKETGVKNSERFVAIDPHPAYAVSGLPHMTVIHRSGLIVRNGAVADLEALLQAMSEEPPEN